MDPKAKLAALQKSMKDIIDGAKGRELSEDEVSSIEAKHTEALDLKGKIERSEKTSALISSISDLVEDDPETPEASKGALTLGSHFVKSMKDAGRTLKSPGSFAAPEFKAATDTQAHGGNEGSYGPLLTDVDRNFVLPKRERLVVENLLGSGSVSGTAITYPVFGSLEGGAAFIGEGAQKPQGHVADPDWKTDALSEVAGWFKMTDDMAEDLPYVVSEIESTMLYDLAIKTEQAILSGDGVGQNLLGIRNREFVQSQYQAEDTAADAIFKAIGKVQTATGFSADGVVIHPNDYETLRLGKDGNGQYMGGGYFAGQYGNGGVVENPPLWGLRTIVTTAIPAGEPLVGSFGQAAKVFRKGGVRVESTNSHANDFTNDLITVRVRARLGLQVKYPAAFVRTFLGQDAPAEG